LVQEKQFPNNLFPVPILLAVPSQINNYITLLFETCKHDHFGGFSSFIFLY